MYRPTIIIEFISFHFILYDIDSLLLLLLLDVTSAETNKEAGEENMEERGRYSLILILI